MILPKTADEKLPPDHTRVNLGAVLSQIHTNQHPGRVTKWLQKVVTFDETVTLFREKKIKGLKEQ